MKASHCDECKHFKWTDQPLCLKNHKPRWYSQKAVFDTDWGYKRRCEDFKKANNSLGTFKKEGLALNDLHKMQN